MIDAASRSPPSHFQATCAYNRIAVYHYEHGLPTKHELERIRRAMLGWDYPVGSVDELIEAVLTELNFTVSVKDGQILSVSRARQEVRSNKPEERGMMRLRRREMVVVPMSNLIEAHAKSWDLDHILPKRALLADDDILEFLRNIDLRAVRPHDADPNIVEVPYPAHLTNDMDLAERLRPEPGAKPLFNHAEVIVISRHRSEKGLDPERQPLASSFAVSEEEAFAELLRLSGLDEHEITAYGLTLEQLSSATALCEKLQEITGDTYEIAVHEVSLPLRPLVKGQFEG